MNPSTAQARVIVDELIRNTVSHVVLCPGSRNAPLSIALYDAADAERLRLHVRVDERGAAFLALGIAARSGHPVALLCTSGTAAANFHPAVLEADRVGVPLIVLTADRPPELRAAGANQVIDQCRLYGNAVRYFDELAVAERRTGQNSYWRSQICRAWNAASGDRRRGPVHLNIPFREPLVPEWDDDEWCESLEGRSNGGRWTELPVSDARTPLLVPSARRGLVLVCGEEARAGGEWAERHGWPVVSEIGGLGLPGDTVLSSGMWLLGVEKFIARHKPEQVLCLGRPSVFRQVQKLLSDSSVEVLLVRPESDWPAPAHNVRQVGRWFDVPAKPADPQWLASWRRADASAVSAVKSTLAGEGWTAGLRVTRDLVDALPEGALLVVGASNSARNVALAGRRRPDVIVHRNRGVAGIDGTVSTAIGAAQVHGGPSYAVLGDLAFLHDASGMLASPAERRPDLTIVVLNDDGGGIFSLLPQGAPEHAASFERVFGTPHGADLSALCTAYRVPHVLAETPTEFSAALEPANGLRVVEVRVDRSRHRDLHARLHTAVSTAISAC